ncbi:heavy-metal-associated domain-containing protein [Jiulongibacter sediminis]|jgi:copper chaperone|uniref:heavy-metal-associated domain-containing protein n=1 Tax=Jiulongibacter sediminis TaxID=1605367 RepID=UPI0026EBEE7B|nr:heavy-metal-associated domain-containing protein [Jiulongibacter sediminis]
MKQQFKTNINCGNCVKTVSPFLNKLEEVDEWKVDTDNPNKILTVEGEDFTAEEIISAIKEAGYEGERVA